MSTMNIHDVMHYGPIMSHDEDMDILISVNGAYFNLWVGDRNGRYNNAECFDMASRINPNYGTANGLYGLDIVKVMDAAEELLREIVLSEADETGERF